MDLFVAETQKRGNQTPTLSGEAIKEEGENIIRSEILSWHQHETKNASRHRVLMLLSYHPVVRVTPKTEIPPVHPFERKMKEPWSTKA